MSPSLYLSKKYYYLLEEWEWGIGHGAWGIGRWGNKEGDRNST